MDGNEGMKILICDDLPEADREFEVAIREAKPDVTIDRMHRGTLREELDNLFKNVENTLVAPDEPTPCKTDFDRDYDIVFLDNNLAYLGISGARLTAESVAGYIRAFSSSRYVVSLNKNPDVDFDLRYLMGDYQTRADLAINTKHLSNSALWTHRKEDATDGFLPSYWPCLNEIGQKRRQQIEFVLENLDKPVLQALKFDENACNLLSRHATGMLSQSFGSETDASEESDPVEATFMDVFSASRRFLPVLKERNFIKFAAEKGSDVAKQIVARVVAATIDNWFRRDVIGPQDVLVDLAHLLPRVPFILGDGAKDVSAWNAALQSGHPLENIDPILAKSHFTHAIFAHDIWVASPCFWWNRISENEELNEFFFREKLDWASAVFCEDRSEFVIRPDDDQQRPFEFVAEFEANPWNRRFVYRIAGFSYVPKSRFAV